MDPSNNQQSNLRNTVPEWFTPPEAIPPPPKPKKSLKPLVLIGGIVVLVGIAALSTLILSRPASTCLDATDYKALTGVELSSDLSPTDTFYDNYALFKDGTLVYDNSTEGGQYGDALIQKLADFYKTHSTKPMVITIGASYLNPDAELLTNQRIATVHSSLLKAGVPENIVVLQGASYVEPEDATEGNGDSGEIAISITADTTCKP